MISKNMSALGPGFFWGAGAIRRNALVGEINKKF